MSQEATDEEIKAAYKRLSKKVNSIVSNSNIKLIVVCAYYQGNINKQNDMF